MAASPSVNNNSVFNSRTYVVEVEDGVWLVDCGDFEPIVEMVGNRNLKGVLLTHGHYDHIYGLNKVLDRWPKVEVFCSELCKEQLFDPKLNYSRYMQAGASLSKDGDALGDEPFVLEERFRDNIHVVEDGYYVYIYHTEEELFADIMAEVVATPGHDDGCLSYMIEEYFFTGDSFIPGVKTVTNLRGDKVKAAESEELINSLIKNNHLTICPGHPEKT